MSWGDGIYHIERKTYWTDLYRMQEWDGQLLREACMHAKPHLRSADSTERTCGESLTVDPGLIKVTQIPVPSLFRLRRAG